MIRDKDPTLRLFGSAGGFLKGLKRFVEILLHLYIKTASPRGFLILGQMNIPLRRYVAINSLLVCFLKHLPITEPVHPAPQTGKKYRGGCHHGFAVRRHPNPRVKPAAPPTHRMDCSNVLVLSTLATGLTFSPAYLLELLMSGEKIYGAVLQLYSQVGSQSQRLLLSAPRNGWYPWPG